MQAVRVGSLDASDARSDSLISGRRVNRKPLPSGRLPHSVSGVWSLEHLFSPGLPQL